MESMHCNLDISVISKILWWLRVETVHYKVSIHKERIGLENLPVFISRAMLNFFVDYHGGYLPTFWRIFFKQITIYFRYWTVTGDNVCSLAFADFNCDGKNELIVGSEDFDIRIFQVSNSSLIMDNWTQLYIFYFDNNNFTLKYRKMRSYQKLQKQMLFQMLFASKIVVLGIHLPMERLEFMTGQLGECLNQCCSFFNNSNTLILRYWRIKSKNLVVVICAFDITGNGKNELITGWSNGSFDARNAKTGEIVFKVNIGT